MFEINESGGNPPVVGASPTEANITKPVFLPHKEWKEHDVIALIDRVLGIDCTNITAISFSDKHSAFTFQLEGCDVAEGPDWQVWHTKNYWLDIDANPMRFDQDELGSVLANYEYGGLNSVRSYLDSLQKVA
jgi:hypothetical protein